jgi:hypothetical protein
MTTVVPKLSKSDSVLFKALQSARAEENASASFAQALKDADASKAGAQQASEAAGNGSLPPVTGADSASDTGSAKSGDLDSTAKKFSDFLNHFLSKDGTETSDI